MVLMIAIAARAEEPMVFDGTNYLPAKMTFTNHVVTFTNLAGRAYEKVKLESVTSGGLIWSTIEGLGGGRVALADLSPWTREQLGIPAGYAFIGEREDKARAAAKVNAHFEAIDRAQKVREQASLDAKKTTVIEAVKELQAAGVFDTYSWNGQVARVKVGKPFFRLTFDQKKLAATAIRMRIQQEAPEVNLVRLMDLYTGNEIGDMSHLGLSLK